jgi:hypothetical protein
LATARRRGETAGIFDVLSHVVAARRVAWFSGNAGARWLTHLRVLLQVDPRGLAVAWRLNGMLFDAGETLSVS